MGGIEPRAIVEINQTASQFTSSIVIRVENRSIDAKSILGLSFTLFGNQNYKLEVYGPDEEEAKKAMAAVFEKHGLQLDVL
ncbi:MULTISPECIES: HPr family phosphocarrier protein [Paenibacillus]|uniref:HPr family phosphocarrier protein n=1 Tax=Paenibacillus TaxID=44249 RepID=UPI0022B88AE2|nr:HPr family phosphocarrier protein [Paenibacillus caseinilyticus]MCZ8518593.1 HPr family phosphocarrier protein [Paenibacillus caseinilyticus]